MPDNEAPSRPPRWLLPLGLGGLALAVAGALLRGLTGVELAGTGCLLVLLAAATFVALLVGGLMHGDLG